MKKTFVWLIISAAFIGPGTVTTATSAGVSFGTTLLWTIPVAVMACIILQEGAARVTIVLGKPFGRVLVEEFQGIFSSIIIPFSIVLGCAAYEAGNILGSVAGVQLAIDKPSYLITLLLSGVAGLLLFTGKFRILNNTLSILIGIMGIGLIILLFSLGVDKADIAHLVIPKVIPGSELIILGLIGTTVVPYNLFLGSRIAEGQTVGQMRKGLTISVIIGGLITTALLVIGSHVEGDFSFRLIADTIGNMTTENGSVIFAFGLFAAGLTSTITAPWAAATLVKSIRAWEKPDRIFRNTWLGVLITGVVFGVLEVQPVPVIILAQALNGLILPFLSFSIFRVLNLKSRMQDQTNNSLQNIGLLLVFGITTVLGLMNFVKAFYRTIDSDLAVGTAELIILTAISAILTGIIAFTKSK